MTVGKLPVMAVELPPTVWTDHGEEGFIPFFVRAITNAAKTAIQKDGYLAPVANVLGFSPDDRTQLMHYVVSLAWFMEHNRGAMPVVMRDLLQRLGAFAVVTATETWTLDCEEAERDYEKYPSLADHPQAIEAMTITVETFESATMHSYPIERSDDGTITGLREDKYGGQTVSKVAGRMANWLQPMPEEAQN